MSEDLADLTRQLRLLGNQAMRLAADVASRENTNETSRSCPIKERDVDIYLSVAEQLYRERQVRQRFFESDLFGEPGWDMLLDLYIAERRGQPISVTAACVGASCSPTTGLRRMHQLEERGLVWRETDPTDARRSFVRLSAEGSAKMTRYLNATRATNLRDLKQSRGCGPEHATLRSMAKRDNPEESLIRGKCAA